MNNSASQIAKTIMNRFTAERQPEGNEYIGEDGLIYCGKCHTKAQTRVEMFGVQRVVNCMCKCRCEEEAERKHREEEQERLERIRRLKSSGIQEKHLLEWRFDVADDNKDIRMAKKYIENWSKAKADNLGLLLWGDVGTGKSFIAACIANALLENGIPVLMTNFSKILNQMGAMYSEERYEYIASFSNYSLLIIDDLGIERNTEYAQEQVYAVIDERYKSGLPVIITTNLLINEIRNPADVAHARIYSRVLEMCTPVHIGGSGAKLKSDIEDSFNPKYADKENDRYDVLITTDVLAEGINLHRSNALINYDLPWNPTRIMQRVGRINRVGTEHQQIYVFNFFPTAQSDKHMPLKDRILEKLQKLDERLLQKFGYIQILLIRFSNKKVNLLHG